jgi:hypothetical protein
MLFGKAFDWAGGMILQKTQAARAIEAADDFWVEPKHSHDPITVAS